MDPRFVTKKIHSYLDYPVAVSLILLPFILRLGEFNVAAQWMSVGTGIAAFILTLLTDHELGAIRVLPFKLHLAVDFMVGVTFVVAPFILGFAGIDAWYYWANGGAVLIVVGLHKSKNAA